MTVIKPTMLCDIAKAKVIVMCFILCYAKLCYAMLCYTTGILYYTILYTMGMSHNIGVSHNMWENDLLGGDF